MILIEYAENAGELSGLGSSECGKVDASGYGVRHLGGRGSGRGESYTMVSRRRVPFGTETDLSCSSAHVLMLHRVSLGERSACDGQ